MRGLSWLIVVAAPWATTVAFAPQRCFHSVTPRATLPFLPSSGALSAVGDGSSGDNAGASRFQGNRREPTLTEIATMDEMISKLLEAKPHELPGAVSRAFRVMSSPQFFLRIAQRADQAKTQDEKERLSALADNLASTLAAVVSSAEDKLGDSAKYVETVVKAAAEPETGEFYVPLVPQQIEAMKTQLLKLDPVALDESFLTTVDSWMNKSHEDGMDGMVTILAKVLQIYAAVAIQRQEAQISEDATTETETDAERTVQKLLSVDTDSWNDELTKAFTSSSSPSPSAVKTVVQGLMETIVLQRLENGSMAQRVQAEFLTELVSRIEKFEVPQAPN